MFRILAIDGGGIRGIYPARFLQWYEKECPLPLHQYFDLITGTSTGAIVALAVARKIPLAKVVELYSTQAHLVFAPRWLNPYATRASKYDNAPLIAQLQKLYGRDGSGGLAALDSVRCPVVIPAVDVVTGTTVVFRTARSGPPTDHGHGADKKIWEVAAASSAAPTYFPAFKAEGDGKSYVDGGLWANDPSLVGVEEALARGVPLADIEILSLGTGSPVFDRPASRQFSSVLSWRETIVDLAFTVQAQGVARIVKQLCGSHYVRIDEKLAGDKPLDDLSVVGNLLVRAKDHAESNPQQVRAKFFTHASLRGPHGKP